MADHDILAAPARPDLVRFAEGFGPRFILTVDTEEEFDWSAPLDRDSHSVVTVPALAKFQQFCEGFGVNPLYLVDYPVATSGAAGEALGEAVRAGRCEIGLQLHPWVNPPLIEDLTPRNSFAGNLPPDLERDKVMALRDAVLTSFGAQPVAYRAGRYGAGPQTARILREAG
ncbi:MAG TPA: WalW protein, partial [Novosphingobium sp.]|nr:WalW protein [Novosphingobium sp.]